MSLKHTFIAFVFLILFSRPGTGQESIINIIWQEEDTVFFSGNLHRVACEFTLDFKKDVKLIIKPEAPLKLLSPSSFKINAVKGETNTSSVKLYLPQTGESTQDSLSCDFILQSLDDNSLIEKKRLKLEIKERVVIRMEAMRSQVPLRAKDSLGIVPLRIKNMGRKKYDVDLFLKKSPEGLKIKKTKRTLLLKPKSDTIINFEIQPNKDFTKIQSAYLKFFLNTSKDDESVANASVSVFPMGHLKKYINPFYTINNTHEFSTGLQIRGGNQIADFSARGRTPFHKGILDYQTSAYHYTDTKTTELSNLNLDYIVGKKSLSLGHVSFNDGLSLSGRGFIYTVDRDSQYIYSGFINGTSNLFDPKLFSESQKGNSIFGGFRHLNDRFGLFGGSGLLKFDPSSNSALFVFSNTFKKKMHYLNTRLGTSLSQNKLDTLLPPVYAGLSLTSDYERIASTWSFMSNNMISSPRYSGNTSGNIASNSKGSFTGWKIMNIHSSFQFRSSKSSTFKNDELLIRRGSIIKYQLQVEPKNLGFWNILLTPYQIFSKRNFLDQDRPLDNYVSNSSRLQLAISRRKGKLTVSCNTDTGIFKYNKEGAVSKQFLSYRFGTKLSYKNLSLSSSYSKGSKLISDALKYEGTEISFSNFQASARWSKWFFERKMKLNLADQISFNSIRQLWINSSVLRIRSILPDGFSADAEIVYYKANTFNELFWNFRLTKKISTYKIPDGAKKLKIFLFEDTNNNGTKEEGEQLLPGIFVRINDIPFITNNDGWVLYKAIPAGDYAINILDPNGEVAGAQEEIFVKENTELFIPLYKTIALSGVVKEIKQRFKASKFSILGVPVMAKNPQEEIFTTYTKPDGSFALKLPKNEYTVYIDPEAFGKNFEFPDNFQKVTLTEEGINDLSLSVKVKSRKMKMKKF